MLNMASLNVTLGDMRIRAQNCLPLLLLPSLQQLDVSDPPTISGQEEEQPLMDDISLAAFLDSLKASCSTSLQGLRMDNWSFRLERPGETLGKLKPALQALTSLGTLSINNYTSMECEIKETGAARVRSLLEARAPLLRCLIKHLPKLERLSIMRSELCPDEVPGLVQALKVRVKKNPITLHTKHVRRCRLHPDHQGVDGLGELVARLAKSRVARETWSGVTGVLRLEAARQPGIIRKLSSLISSESEDTGGS